MTGIPPRTDTGKRVRRLRHLVLCLVLAGPFSGEALAQEAASPGVRYDSSTVVPRPPADDALEAYRRDPAFDYDGRRPALDTVPWWLRWWRWLKDRVLGPLQSPALEPVRRVLYYLLLAAVVGFAVLRLLRMEGRALFTKTGRPAGVLFDEHEADLDSDEVDRLIEAAVAGKDFRQAGRLVFLKALNTLAARGLVGWQQDKTNHAYLEELRASPLLPGFTELTYLFEHIWYGRFPAEEAAFLRMKAAFARFEQQLQDAGAISALDRT